MIGGYAREWQWTGFPAYVPKEREKQDIRQARTLWDWMQLLLIPAVLAVGGLFFNWAQDIRQDENSKAIADAQMDSSQRIADAQREAEEKRAMSEALQAYFDDMKELMLNDTGLNEVQKGYVKELKRARTLTILKRLDLVDPDQKRSVLQFLYEAGMIGYLDKDGRPCASIIPLVNADLSDADLTDLPLAGANLYGTNLDKAALTQEQLELTIMPNGSIHDQPADYRPPKPVAACEAAGPQDPIAAVGPETHPSFVSGSLA
jgi:hypothetical protein